MGLENNHNIDKEIQEKLEHFKNLDTFEYNDPAWPSWSLNNYKTIKQPYSFKVFPNNTNILEFTKNCKTKDLTILNTGYNDIDGLNCEIKDINSNNNFSIQKNGTLQIKINLAQSLTITYNPNNNTNIISLLEIYDPANLDYIKTYILKGY